MKYRIYTGPTIVRDIAQRLIDAGVQVTIEGTEHVYIETALTAFAVATILMRENGWKERDVRQY